jgi:hypothetical protein
LLIVDGLRQNAAAAPMMADLRSDFHVQAGTSATM